MNTLRRAKAKLIDKNDRETSLPNVNVTLHQAVNENNIEAIKILLRKKGTEVNFQDKNGWTPFMVAASYGYYEICDLFLNVKHCDVQVHNQDGNTALHYLVRKPGNDPEVYASILRRMLDRKIDVNAKNKLGEGPIHAACMYNNAEAVLFLISSSADVDLCNGLGETPLHYASRSQQHDMVKLLVQAGAKTEIDSNTTSPTATRTRKRASSTVTALAKNHNVSQPLMRLILENCLKYGNGNTDLNASTEEDNIPILEKSSDIEEVVKEDDFDSFSSFNAVQQEQQQQEQTEELIAAVNQMTFSRKKAQFFLQAQNKSREDKLWDILWELYVQVSEPMAQSTSSEDLVYLQHVEGKYLKLANMIKDKFGEIKQEDDNKKKEGEEKKREEEERKRREVEEKEEMKNKRMTLRIKKEKKDQIFLPMEVHRVDDTGINRRSSTAETPASGESTPTESGTATPTQPREDRSKLPPEVRQELFRMDVFNELISTETDYVNDLEVVISLFVKPLRDPERSGVYLKPSDINNIFLNMETMIPMHQELLRQLKHAQSLTKEEQNVGQIFMQMAPFLKMYGAYCSRSEDQYRTLNKAKTKNSAFANFCRDAQLKPEAHRLDLASFLIKPLQRLCRYPLLLRELSKYTPDEHVDKERLIKGIEEVTNVISLVNEQKRQAEIAAQYLAQNNSAS